MLTPRKLLPNTNPLKYAQEGYCVFRQQFTGEEMKLHQQTLDGMLDCLRPDEKPQFMLAANIGELSSSSHNPGCGRVCTGI